MERQPAVAETSTAVIGLRAGYDGNPTNAEGAAGSPVMAGFATWDHLRGSLDDGFGATLQLGYGEYDPRILAAARSNALTLRHATTLAGGLVLQSSLNAADEATWSRRRGSVGWRERLDHRFGAWRLFLSGEARLTALNERNVFADGGFLPLNETFASLAATPGLAWRSGASEIGASLGLTRVSFTEPSDYLGLRRSHDRFQPNVFASTSLGDVALEGSLSPFRALFPAKDFEPVASLLYTAKAKWPLGPVTLEVSSQRGVEDTTLPFSVINLAGQHEAKANWRIDETNAVSLTARVRLDHYTGLDARSATRGLAFDYVRQLAPGLSATATAAWRKSKDSGGAPISAFSVQFGLQRQIDFGATATEPEVEGKPAAKRPSKT